MQDVSETTAAMATWLHFGCMNHSYSILVFKCILFLMVKADVQCMSDRPQTGCFGQPKVQVKSCINHIDFPTPQYVKNSSINAYTYINSFLPHKLELVGLDESFLLCDRNAYFWKSEFPCIRNSVPSLFTLKPMFVLILPCSL